MVYVPTRLNGDINRRKCMGISGFVALRIHSNKLDFDDISNNIKLQPTYICHKGDIITNRYKFGDKVQKEDRWLYEVKFDDSQDLDDVVNEFILKLSNCRNYIKMLYKKYYVRLWCDIYSDLAQFGISFTPDTIQKIAELGIGVDIQMYSYGELSQ